MKVCLNFIAIFLLTLISLSGCVIQSSQLNNIFELIKEPSLDLSENSWALRYSDYETIVYAISTSDGILFSNNSGDQVLFDGWTVRVIEGIGRRQLSLKISDNLSLRSFKRGNRLVSTHTCDGWETQKSLGAIRYLQFCNDGNGYHNSILVQNTGEISVIRQIVDERYTALTLTKLH